MFDLAEKLLDANDSTNKKTTAEAITTSDQEKIIKDLPPSDIQEPLEEINTSKKQGNSKKSIHMGLKFAGILLTTILIPIILSA